MKLVRPMASALALLAVLASAASLEGAQAEAQTQTQAGVAASSTGAALPPGHVRGPAPATAPGRDRSRVTDADRSWWAFQPLRRAEPPAVRAAGQAHTAIDRFILARLEEKRLKLNPPADRRTLLRRASFDLLGLPPTPEDVEAFVHDPAPDAWARRVAQMLASPRHGERWARHWLDVARFAESSGFEHDYDRPSAYHYRDFVIRALNEDR